MTSVSHAKRFLASSNRFPDDPEVLQDIFRFLPGEDLWFTARAVCHSWRICIENIKLHGSFDDYFMDFREELAFCVMYDKAPMELLKRFDACALYVSQYSFEYWGTFKTTILLSCKNLRSITMLVEPDPSLTPIAFPEDFLHWYALLLRNSQHTLKILEASYVGFHLPVFMPKLEKLDLSGRIIDEVISSRPDTIKQLFRNFDRNVLKELKLCDVPPNSYISAEIGKYAAGCHIASEMDFINHIPIEILYCAPEDHPLQHLHSEHEKHVQCVHFRVSDETFDDTDHEMWKAFFKRFPKALYLVEDKLGCESPLVTRPTDGKLVKLKEYLVEIGKECGANVRISWTWWDRPYADSELQIEVMSSFMFNH